MPWVSRPTGARSPLLAFWPHAAEREAGALNTLRPVWFFWPGTFGLVATLAAVHLFLLGGASRRTTRFPLSALAIVSVAFAIVPLMFGVSPRCSDELLDIRFNLNAVVLGGLGVVAWLGLLWRLYVSAGMDPGSAQRPAVVLGCVLAAGMVVETFVSAVTLGVYCTGGSGAVYGHLAAAAAISLLAGTLLALHLRAQDS